MTDQVVADSSIFLAAVLEEPYSKLADASIRQWSKQGVQVVGLTSDPAMASKPDREK